MNSVCPEPVEGHGPGFDKLSLSAFFRLCANP